MSEEDMTQVDREVRVNWLIFNVPQMAVLISIVAGGIAGYYDVVSRLDQTDASREERARFSDRRFSNIENTLAAMNMKTDRLPMLEQRTTALETQMVETNKRLDRFTELINAGIDSIKKDVNNLTVKTEVNTDKLDRLIDNMDANVPQRRTELFTPKNEVR